MRKIVLLSVAVALAAATQARAGVSVDVRINAGPPCPPPLVVYGCEQVWVPPVTQTVTSTVWHEPVTQDQVSSAWVPDRYDWRVVPTVDPYGCPAAARQYVLVEPGHWQDVHTPVVVRAGYWGPEAQAVVVVPGHWETVRQPAVVVVGPAYGPVYGPRPYLPPPPPYAYDRGDRYRGRR